MLTRWRRWNLNYLTDHSRQLMRRRRHRDDSISSDCSRAARMPSKMCPFEGTFPELRNEISLFRDENDDNGS
jgi:hypothetical protein